jgi:hypothetical protein
MRSLSGFSFIDAAVGLLCNHGQRNQNPLKPVYPVFLNKGISKTNAGIVNSS